MWYRTNILIDLNYLFYSRPPRTGPLLVINTPGLWPSLPEGAPSANLHQVSIDVPAVPFDSPRA